MNKDGFSGPYNAVSPNHIDNNTFIKKLAKTAKRPFWPLNVPSFILQLLFGEMSTIILNGSRISSLMAVKQGFVFDYADLEMTFNDLI